MENTDSKKFLVRVAIYAKGQKTCFLGAKKLKNIIGTIFYLGNNMFSLVLISVYAKGHFLVDPLAS